MSIISRLSGKVSDLVRRLRYTEEERNHVFNSHKGDFYHKKRMLTVAKPILDVFLDGHPKKREVLKRIVCGTRGLTIDEELSNLKMARKYLSGTKGGYYNRSNRTTRVKSKAHSCVYAHEALHALSDLVEGSISNDYVVSHAIDNYLRNIYDQMESIREYGCMFKLGFISETPGEPEYISSTEIDSLIHPENVRELTAEERKDARTEYDASFYRTGQDLGHKAAILEAQTQMPGIGLFFIKLVDRGMSLEEAEKLVREGKVEGMKEFREKYAEQWKDLFFYKN